MSPKNIIFIHERIQRRISITAGKVNLSNLKNVADMPDTYVGGVEQFDTVFKKAASLTESMIRLHPFVDGNKRTVLLSTLAYLLEYGYGVIVPYSAVRRTVLMAKNADKGPNETKKVNDEFSIWLKKHSYKTKKEGFLKLVKYIIIPYLFYYCISKIGFIKHVEKVFNEWLAIDMYPEYEQESKQIIKFISDCTT